MHRARVPGAAIFRGGAWFDEGQLWAVDTMAATAILTTRIAEVAAITVAEFIVAAPSSEAEQS